ncbi:hypothetical protein DFH09DRAFT_1142441 [Mycena vulgaris]|nr:hypothetical protein DFH09DRAFT_1142441 [Mycena vulgaris]
MVEGGKRKRDSSIPTLVYSSTGYSRFAKLFTETSLDEIKEIVRKRLQLSSVADFNLFYDTDIALVNDDDFDAFEAHAHAQSAGSPVNVVVKVVNQSHAPTTGGSSSVARSTDPVISVGGVVGDSPPRKRRKVAAVAPDPTASISSAPSQKKQKGDATVVDDETISAIPEGASNGPPKPPGEGPEKRKKRKKNVDAKDLDDAQLNSAASITVPGGTSSANQVPDPSTGAQERPKKKSKKVTEKDAPKSAASANALDGPSSVAEPQVENQRKPKSKKAPPVSAPPKSSISQKSTKKSKKDPQTEDVPNADDQAQNSVKSVTFSFPDQLAKAISGPADDLAESGPASRSRQRQKIHPNVEPSSSEKVKKPSKGKKKTVEQSLEDVDSPEQIEPEETVIDPAVKDFLKSLVQKLPTAPAPVVESHLATAETVQPAAKATKKSASSKGQASTAANTTTPCAVCKTSPFHLRSRCPIVLAGSGPIKKRIAELQQDDTADHSQLIQELRSIAEKSERTSKTKAPQNVNAHSPVLPRNTKKGGVSNPSVDVPGHAVAVASGSGPRDDGRSSSSDDSESEAPTTRKVLPFRPADSSVDAELDAIIRGPGGPSRITLDDILFEEEGDEDAQSVVLEDDGEEDLKFRRRSWNIDAAASSDEELGEDDDGDSQAGKVAEGRHSPVVNISARADSRRSSTRSVTEPLLAIHLRQSTDVDPTGDIAVEDAMASDNAIFRMETPVFAEGGESPAHLPDSPNRSTRTTPIPSTPTGSPRRDKKANSNLQQVHTPEITTADDPIQPAEDFPPTPVQPAKTAQPGTPSTPRMVQRMKDRNGKIPVRLSQLDPPFSLTPRSRTTLPKMTQDDAAKEDQADEDAVSQRTRTRSSTRVLSVEAIPPPSEAQQPAKRRRAPNKTPEQRAEEAAAKLAAKEERDRLRKEKADAKAETKAAGRNGLKNMANCPPTDPESSKATPPPKLVLDSAASVDEPVSQDEWTVLKSASPHDEEYRDHESMRDELHSSSPAPLNDGDREEEAPLFLPAASQVPFPYSQWNSIPEEFCPGSPKESGDEEDEEEVAASVKSSQRPGAWRRLTDIAKQASLFSTPPLQAAAVLPASFPRAKDKRDELYGAIPQEDDSTDSDSSAGDAPSHIPKSRRAGMATR